MSSALASSALPSERRLAANRANALLSTGPATPEGKAKSSLNAVKTGLTGRTVLLPNEDAAAYETHIERFQKEFQPVGDRETQLVQSLADTQWRLDRIPGLEFGLFALGRKRYADLFEEEEDAQVRAALLDAHILMTEARHFKNLHLQESRLRRQYQQDAQELRELQESRKEEEQEEAEEPTAFPERNAARMAAHGFEFSNPRAAEFRAVRNRKKL
jgi:cell division protein FtsB